MKKWLLIGGGLILTIAAILGLRKEEEKHDEKIRKMISDVDMKPKEEVKTVEELSSDVDSAISGMDIDGDDEPRGRTFDEIQKKYDDMKAWKQEILDRQKDPKVVEQEPDLQDLQKRNEEYFKTTWVTDVEKAVKAKNYSKLEGLFDEKYAGGPWHPSPASVFTNARADGVIDDATMRGAEKYFGRLWNYSGD